MCTSHTAGHSECECCLPNPVTAHEGLRLRWQRGGHSPIGPHMLCLPNPGLFFCKTRQRLAGGPPVMPVRLVHANPATDCGTILCMDCHHSLRVRATLLWNAQRTVPPTNQYIVCGLCRQLCSRQATPPLTAPARTGLEGPPKGKPGGQALG